MTEYQTAKHNMYGMILKEASNNESAVNLIPGFKDGINTLRAIHNEMESTRMLQEVDLTGIAADKQATIDDLADITVEVAGAVYSYADKKNNRTLMEKVNYKESVIENLTNAELLSATGIILQEAVNVPAADLENEGISQEEMNRLRELYDLFHDVKSKPREAIIDRRGYTKKLAELFRKAYRVKKNTLDRLAPQYKRKAPEFYDTYKAASIILFRKAAKKKEESK